MRDDASLTADVGAPVSVVEQAAMSRVESRAATRTEFNDMVSDAPFSFVGSVHRRLALAQCRRSCRDLIEHSYRFPCRTHGMPCDVVCAAATTVRYHDAHQLSSFVVLFRMTFLCRLLVVGLLALLAMSGASACEPAQQDASSSPVSHVAHRAVAADDHCGVTEPASTHDRCAGHANDCAASCCGHCAAPPVGTRIGTGVPERSPRFAPSAALRAGITHAPPLPPPIV
ncbi:hypothetical protein [Paraburkholderia sacchari]|uniref:hypothetical protein n=1 Tax=Paraburkholderia sacchari TaxID=159450 RepID=UPI001BCEE344|nr:hypothetical protein [Paraburkholderia sacchari]